MIILPHFSSSCPLFSSLSLPLFLLRLCGTAIFHRVPELLPLPALPARQKQDYLPPSGAAGIFLGWSLFLPAPLCTCTWSLLFKAPVMSFLCIHHMLLLISYRHFQSFPQLLLFWRYLRFFFVSSHKTFSRGGICLKAWCLFDLLKICCSSFPSPLSPPLTTSWLWEASLSYSLFQRPGCHY